MEHSTDMNTPLAVESVVRRQYQALLAHPETKPIFMHLQLENHLPRIFQFWCFILDIDAENNPYKGSAFEPHTRLGLTEKHFEIWLQCLSEAVSIYEGEKATLMREKAAQLALFFQYKLGIIPQSINIKK